LSPRPGKGVGNIIDFWRLKRAPHWTQLHSDVIRAVLSKAGAGTTVTLVPGNHDEYLRRFCDLQLGSLGSDGHDVLAVGVGGALVLAGQALNVSVFYRLGAVGVFYGDRLGQEVPWCREFPFSVLSHPQYVGTVLSIWGFFVAMRFPHDDWILLPTLEAVYYVVGTHLEEGGGASDRIPALSGEEEPGWLQSPVERVQHEAKNLEGDHAEQRFVAWFAENHGRVPLALRQRDVTL